MNVAQTSSDTAALATERQRLVLERLIALGMEVAEAVVEEMRAGATAAGTTVPLERVSRCVRRSIMLMRRLDEPVSKAERSEDAERRARKARMDKQGPHEWSDEDLAAAVVEEEHERAERGDYEEPVDDRPAEEIIAEICQDLGLVEVADARVWRQPTVALVASLLAGVMGRGEVIGSGGGFCDSG